MPHELGFPSPENCTSSWLALDRRTRVLPFLVRWDKNPQRPSGPSSSARARRPDVERGAVDLEGRDLSQRVVQHISTDSCGEAGHRRGGPGLSPAVSPPSPGDGHEPLPTQDAAAETASAS